ncbi:MAG: terminase large subunit, partial [Rhizobium sp.]
SGSRDLTAFIMVFPDEGRSFDIVSQFFMPEANIAERSNEDRVPYDLWAKQGFITLIPGSTIDPSFVAMHVFNAQQTYDLRTVAYDRWRIEDFKRELGIFGGGVPLQPFGQGYRDMSPAVDTLERSVAEKMLRHGGNPVLNMCASNAVVTRDPAGSRKLDKSKASGRIDGLVALAMALQVSGRHEPEEMPSCLAEFME